MEYSEPLFLEAYVTRTSRKPSTLSEPLHHRLNAYALAASAAGVGVLALAQPADAKVVYTKAHIRIAVNSTYDLSLNNNGATDFSFSNTAATRGYKFGAGLLVRPALRSDMVWVSTFVSGYHFAGALNRGQEIGPNPKFTAGWQAVALLGSNIASNGPWCEGGAHYLGVKFGLNEPAASHFGWVRMNVVCDHDASALITGYAYETIPNKPIIAGKTKGPDVITVQPASLGHLANGASAIPAGRKAGNN